MITGVKFVIETKLIVEVFEICQKPGFDFVIFLTKQEAITYKNKKFPMICEGPSQKKVVLTAEEYDELKTQRELCKLAERYEG